MVGVRARSGVTSATCCGGGADGFGCVLVAANVATQQTIRAARVGNMTPRLNLMVILPWKRHSPCVTTPGDARLAPRCLHCIWIDARKGFGPALRM